MVYLRFIIATFCVLLAPVPAQAQTLIHELTSPNEQFVGGFGISVGGIEDLNGDGLGDLIAGAWQEDAGSVSGAGRAYVFSGETGVSLHELESPNPWGGGNFGVAVSGVTDLNGDGYGDLVVGAPGEPIDDPFIGQAGHAYVFDGATGTLLHNLMSPNPLPGGSFGIAVAGVPDADGDGRGDLLIGASGEGPFPFQNLGRAYVFSGATGVLIYEINSPSPEFDGYFGREVAGVPDTDGDGRGDLLIGANLEGPGFEGRAYLFSGATGALLHPLAAPDPESEQFGLGVSGVPDTDGDGRGELFVSAAGVAYLFSGTSGALLHTLTSPNPGEIDVFGASIGSVSDVDGDGRGDLVVGATREAPGSSPPNAGRAHVFSGATGTLLFTLASPNEEENRYFGGAVAGVPDADGDGRGDLLIRGSEELGQLPDGAGRVYLFSGMPSAPDVTLTATALSPLTVAPGGMVDFRYTVTNATTTTVSGDLFFVAERSGAAVASGVVTSGTLTAGQPVTRTFTQQVPGNAPAGTYSYTLSVGHFPSTVLDSETFAVEIVDSLRPPSAGGWTVDSSSWDPEPGHMTATEAVPSVSVSPNPFARRAAFSFTLAEAGPATLTVYDVRGRAVATLADGMREAGRHMVVLEANGLPSGVYIWSLATEGSVETGRLTVVK